MTEMTQSNAAGTRVLPVAVNNRIATYAAKERLVCDNSDYLLRFAFDEEWETYVAKTARVRYSNDAGETFVHDLPFGGNDCHIPIIPKTEHIFVGVYAGNLRTSTEAEIPCVPSALSENGAPADPPPDVYNSLMEHMDEIAQLNEGQADRLVRAALAEAKNAGEFDGADGRTPTRGVDYWTEEDIEAISAEVDQAVTDAVAAKTQLYPLFADSLADLQASGDPSRVYVLPDGYIYAWQKQYGPLFTNLADPDSDEWVNDYCLDDNNPILDPFEGTVAANLISVNVGDVLRVSGIDLAAGHIIGCFQENMLYFGGANILRIQSGESALGGHFYVSSVADPCCMTLRSQAIKYIRFSGVLTGTAEEVIITKNEEIAYGITYAWGNTGRAFVPADYEDRIRTLEEKISKMEAHLG